MYLKEKIILCTAVSLLLSGPVVVSFQDAKQRYTPKACVKWGERTVTRTTSWVQDGVLITGPKPFKTKHCMEREYVES